MAKHEGKGDLKLMGEISKRVAGLQPAGKSLLVAALEDRLATDEVEAIRQVVERYTALTVEGREYVDKLLEVDRSPSPA